MVSAMDLYQPNADWSNVTVERLNSRGDLCTKDDGNPAVFEYTLEKSTGDLYGLKGKPDSPQLIAAKSFGLILFTPFYTAGMMCANLLKVVVDITSIFWKVIPQFLQDISTKGIRAGLGNSVIAIIYEIPNEIILDLWRVTRSPFFALAIEVACVYGLFSPYEGRKWIGKIENQWHEGTPYNKHLDDSTANRCVDEMLFEGKVMFMAICMQKMGNINDQVGKLEKYKIVVAK